MFEEYVPRAAAEAALKGLYDSLLQHFAGSHEHQLHKDRELAAQDDLVATNIQELEDARKKVEDEVERLE